MHPEFLYHGSPSKIEGILLPNMANCQSGRQANTQRGIYATDIREFAIIMGILKSEGVHNSSLDFDCEQGELHKGIIYSGWPTQEQIFLYTLSSQNFIKMPDTLSSRQWISYESVMPVSSEILEIKDFIHLVRKANTKDVAKHLKKN